MYKQREKASSDLLGDVRDRTNLLLMVYHFFLFSIIAIHP